MNDSDASDALTNPQLAGRVRSRAECRAEREAVRARDFERLVQEHRPTIYRRALYLLGDHHDAEEVTQEVALRLFRSLDSFQGRASFRTWLGSVIDNQCYTLAARRSRQALSTHLAERLLIHEQSLLRDSRASEVDAERVRGILQGMPRAAREVLRLRFFYDHSLEAIASSLGISLSAAKMRLYRALEEFGVRYGAPERRTCDETPARARRASA